MNPVVKAAVAAVPEEKKKGTVTLIASVAAAAILLPLIAVFGLFSVTGTKTPLPASYSLSSADIYRMERLEDIADTVSEVFAARGLTKDEADYASFLAFTLLENEQKNEAFYEKLADAFEEEGDPADNVMIYFGINRECA